MTDGLSLHRRAQGGYFYARTIDLSTYTHSQTVRTDTPPVWWGETARNKSKTERLRTTALTRYRDYVYTTYQGSTTRRMIMIT